MTDVQDVIARARQHAAAGWRPTHQEVRQMLELIDSQADQLARQPIGYLIADQIDDLARFSGDQSVGPVSLHDAVHPFLAPPAPIEVASDERVVAVYELPE